MNCCVNAVMLLGVVGHLRSGRRLRCLLLWRQRGRGGLRCWLQRGADTDRGRGIASVKVGKTIPLQRRPCEGNMLYEYIYKYMIRPHI